MKDTNERIDDSLENREDIEGSCRKNNSISFMIAKVMSCSNEIILGATLKNVTNRPFYKIAYNVIYSFFN